MQTMSFLKRCSKGTDIKRLWKGYAAMAGMDDSREQICTQAAMHMSIMCIISLVNYQALNTGTAC